MRDRDLCRVGWDSADPAGVMAASKWRRQCQEHQQCWKHWGWAVPVTVLGTQILGAGLGSLL